MEQVINLEREDELSAIFHLLEGVQARRVLLVIPKGNRALRQPLNLRLLRRRAVELALDVAIISRDGTLRQLAMQEGLVVAPTVGWGKRVRRQMAAPKRTAAQRAAVARIAALRRGRSDIGYSDQAIVWVGRFLGLVLFLGMLAVIAGLAALTIPEAHVTVVPFHKEVEASLELRADPEVEKASLSDLVIPARLVEVTVESRGQTATVATRDSPDAPATGLITFVNQVAEGREIVPGAVVRTSTGTTVRFRTVTTATIDAHIGARAEAQIEAVEPGPVGNVAALTINAVETAALRGKVAVINEQPTQGGGVKQVGVVTRADMDRLKAQLLQQLQERAYGELQEQLEENEFIPAESVTIETMAEVFDQFLDAETDVLHLDMRILATGTAVDRAHAELLAGEKLEELIQDTFALRSEDILFTMDEDVRMEGRNVLVTATASASLIVDIDPRKVRSAVKGLRVDEAVVALEDPEQFALDAPPIVVVEPEWIKRWSWLDRVPYLGYRIQVVVLK